MKSEVSLTELYNEVCESITLLVRENESLRKEIHHLKELSETSSRSEIENLKAEIESLHDTIQELENGKKTYEEKFHTILKILRGAASQIPEIGGVAASKVQAKPEVRHETKLETILPPQADEAEEKSSEEAIPPRRGPPPEKTHETPKSQTAPKAEPKAAVDASYKEDDPFSDEGEFQDDDDFFKSLTSKTNE